MATTADIPTVVNAIQLSVAPVFLLTGIGAMLAVMATRLARIVDRFRILNESGDDAYPFRHGEMDVLLHRSTWIHWAITLSTVSALFVCLVIAALFVGSELSLAPSRTVSILFIIAMLALILGLLCLLREIALSRWVIRHEIPTRQS